MSNDLYADAYLKLDGDLTKLQSSAHEIFALANDQRCEISMIGYSKTKNEAVVYLRSYDGEKKLVQFIRIVKDKDLLGKVVRLYNQDKKRIDLEKSLFVKKDFKTGVVEKVNFDTFCRGVGQVACILLYSYELK